MADDILYRFTGVPPHHSLFCPWLSALARQPRHGFGTNGGVCCVLIEMFIALRGFVLVSFRNFFKIFKKFFDKDIDKDEPGFSLKFWREVEKNLINE